MPYSNNADLPESVRNALPSEAQTTFRAVVNNALEQYDGDESRAFATAWAALRRAGWDKGNDGKWVQKQDGASTPAPPGDRIRGSPRNKPGSAAGSSGGIEVGPVTEATLERKVREHNERHGDKSGKRVTTGMLKAVYRRGAGAFSVSHRPGMTRNQWAMGRVNAFLHLVRSGSPENSAYVTDNDLLPSGHPRKSKGVSKAEGFAPPQAVRNNAKRGLEMRQKYGRGGLDTQEAGRQGIGSGVARARDLAAGKSVSAETIRRMVAFFARHEKNKDSRTDSGEPGAGMIAWLLWGGDAGRRWAESIVNRLEKGGDGLADWETEFEIAKTADEQQLVFGWLSVSQDKDGSAIIDKQGDVIPPDELEKAAYDFVLYARRAGEMHKRTEGIGRLVESVIMTVEKQQVMGIPPNTVPVGWWVGFKIDDPGVWAKVKSGEYRAFSIGGSGQREEVNYPTAKAGGLQSG